MIDFYDLDLDDKVLDALDAMRFEKCTPIQEKTIPPILEGRDVMGIAQTGTGKTAAYLLPIINQLYVGEHCRNAINCIVMSPTRELAQQIDQAMEGFSYFVPVSSVAVYGGNDGIRYEQESRSLKLGTDMIIATPGRLLAHIQLEKPDFLLTKRKKGSVRWYNTIVNRFVKNVFTVYLPCSPCKKHKFKNL